MAKLNAAQAAAVEHHEGPLLVLAGAGSGKTRVITQRIARLVERGVRAERILAVTFTNKASIEMGERLAHLTGPHIAKRVNASTFHSFGVRFLGEENRALGYDGRFVIFDQGDCLGILRDLARRELGVDKAMDIAALLTRISLHKNAFRAPEDVPETAHEYDSVARDLYPLYQRTLSSMHAVDFDDLVVAPVRIMMKHEHIRQKWQNRFQYMLVDEFQDTNKSQLELVRLLANEQRNVCVVGDDDQSIYGWRGAEVGNILDFERYFPGATIVKLEENYRSREAVLHVANAAIAKSRGTRHEKRLVPTRLGGDKVRMVRLDDSAAEARFVAHEIKEIAKNDVAWKQMAVLYRSNMQARLIEEELRAAGVPYRMFGGTQFYDRREIKDAIAYLRVAVHPTDELSIRRIVNQPPRGLGEQSLDRIVAFGARRDKKLFETLEIADDIDGLPELAKRGAREIVHAIGRAREGFKSSEGLVATADRLLQDVGMTRALTELDGKDGDRRRENLAYLMRSLERYEQNGGAEKLSVDQFLTRITMRFDGDEEEAGNRVTLSSLHSAKGLEFDYVMFIGCVEGVLPHSRTTDPKVTEAVVTDVDEERRLFYVGVTRARERLYITFPMRRMVRGRMAPFTPSRFLDGLPEEWLEHMDDPNKRVLEADQTAANAAAIIAMLGRRS